MENPQFQPELECPAKVEGAALAGGFALHQTIDTQQVPERWTPERGDYFDQHEIPFGD